MLHSSPQAAEETGWKLVHGDVFRKPRRPDASAGQCGKAELRLSPFLRCSDSIFWRISADIPVKFW